MNFIAQQCRDVSIWTDTEFIKVQPLHLYVPLLIQFKRTINKSLPPYLNSGQKQFFFSIFDKY